MDSRPISRFAIGLTATLMLAAAPAAIARTLPVTAKTEPAAATSGNAAAVQAFYKRWQGPAWFHDNGTATELAGILRRAPLDGFAAGPDYAKRVEQAAQQAASGKQSDRAAAERVLSEAWTAYVEAIRRPTKGMIYAYPAMAPKPANTQQILTDAAAAPSLRQHLADTAGFNPVYAELRQTAWQQFQSAPDARIVANLDRLRSLPAKGRFALVNVPTQRLIMYENGKQVDSMKVIVGNQQYPTPMIASVIYYTTFNPYWNVPDHLVRKTIAANVLKQGNGYLKARGYQIMSDWTTNATVIPPERIDWNAVATGKTNIRVRQLPGPQNSMGQYKFSFANGQDIYLHDTPSKALFGKEGRNLSNGCVRLEDAARFGRWLLGRPPVAPSADPELFVQLPQGVPIFITYTTAQQANGKISYVPDIYGLDPAGAS